MKDLYNNDKVIFLDEVDSTNNYAKELIHKGCEDDIFVIAKKQFAGRGRLGRTWVSDNENGLWLSVIISPNLSNHLIQVVSLAACVAVVKALRNITKLDYGIKWPNDIIINGRKVCGILTEFVTNDKNENMIIIGIGINVNQKNTDFGEDIHHKAISISSVLHKNVDKDILLKEVMKELLNIKELLYDKYVDEIINLWRENSITLGKEVVFNHRVGKAKDIENNGNLVVEFHDGGITSLASGEIMIKGIYI